MILFYIRLAYFISSIVLNSFSRIRINWNSLTGPLAFKDACQARIFLFRPTLELLLKHLQHGQFLDQRQQILWHRRFSRADGMAFVPGVHSDNVLKFVWRGGRGEVLGDIEEIGMEQQLVEVLRILGGQLVQVHFEMDLVADDTAGPFKGNGGHVYLLSGDE